MFKAPLILLIISPYSCGETGRWDGSSRPMTTQHRWSNASDSTTRPHITPYKQEGSRTSTDHQTELLQIVLTLHIRRTKD